MKKYLLDFLIVVLILGGVGLLLFPVISDHRNRAQASALIVTYNNEIDQKSEEEKEKMLQDAREHNRVLSGANIALDGSAIPGYEQLLNVTRTGIMGYLGWVRSPLNRDTSWVHTAPHTARVSISPSPGSPKCRVPTRVPWSISSCRVGL